jgi:hypothetical protein
LTSMMRNSWSGAKHRPAHKYAADTAKGSGVTTQQESHLLSRPRRVRTNTLLEKVCAGCELQGSQRDTEGQWRVSHRVPVNTNKRRGTPPPP